MVLSYGLVVPHGNALPRVESVPVVNPTTDIVWESARTFVVPKDTDYVNNL